MARKVVKKKTTGTAIVSVGRMDNFEVSVKVPAKYTILQALAKFGYNPAEGESIRDARGNECDGNDLVKDKIGYFLVQDVKSR